jgi:hypothetical protein
MKRVLNRVSLFSRHLPVRSNTRSWFLPLTRNYATVEPIEQIKTHPLNAQYKIGDDIHGWKLLDVKYIPEFNVTTYLCEHTKTGIYFYLIYV